MTTKNQASAAPAEFRTALTSDGVEIEDGDWVCWSDARSGDEDAVEVGRAEVNASGVLEIVWDGSGREMVGGSTLPGTCSVYAGLHAEQRARALFERLTEVAS